ncbi:tetratricopeptide repeat protein [Soonwooa sp.]|uniref:tetratricopeptide repeat protein n=1 Tax=Soonwooa sp. TaxID=1938592 RepID=UPI00261A2FBB|nr:tetratricopeptide repeat protein [Soonwooa sp.]
MEAYPYSKVKRLGFCIILFFLLANFSLAQNRKDEINTLITKAQQYKFKDWTKAESLLSEAQKQAKTQEELGDFYIEASKIYSETNRFDIALDYSRKAYNIFYKTSPQKIAEIDDMFAFVYTQLNDTPKAIEYYKKLLAEHIKNANTYEEIKTYNNLGNAFFVLKKLDSSNYYFSKALTRLDAFNKPELKVYVLANLGKVASFQGEKKKALDYLEQAEAILNTDKIENPKAFSLVYFYLINYYNSVGLHDKALGYVKKMDQYTNKANPNFVYRDLLWATYNTYLDQKDYKNAAYSFKTYDSIREQLNIEEKAVSVERTKLKHDYESQKKIDELIQDKRQSYYIAGAIFLLLCIVISVLAVINYRNKVSKLELEKLLQVARTNKLEIENHMKEKQLVYKSIEQSKIEEIFKSIMEQIDHLKLKVQNQKIVDEISHIILEIKTNMKTNSWEEFEHHFVNIHESFYKNLEAKHPDLTTYDRRLAAMILLKLSTKEISNLLNVTPKTIENSRTRLRKKLNLTNTQSDIYQYLNSFTNY